MRQHSATFSNFICRFGEKKVLRDYLDDIVIPAFIDDNLIRKYGDTRFLFYGTKIMKFDRKGGGVYWGIAGRFIKDTILTREQIFDQRKGLIHNEAELRSSPSAFFILLINNHKLIYFPETPHAPDLSAFRATMLKFIRTKRLEFLNRLYNNSRDGEDKVTKKKLKEKHPDASLEIIPITSREKVQEFVGRFEILKKIEFYLVTPNDELDGKAIFNDMREYLAELKPERMKIETANSSGLEKEEAVSHIKAATATANQYVKLLGIDHDGNKLKGDNHNFNIETAVDPKPDDVVHLAKRLFQTYEDLAEAGLISENELKYDSIDLTEYQKLTDK